MIDYWDWSHHWATVQAERNNNEIMSSLSLAGRISRYYKLTPTRFFTSAAARRGKYGGGSVHKFRLAQRRAEFFPAAAARHASGWQRRRNSAAEGSTKSI